ncbi:MAG: ATP-binding protein [Patescibacteria group bacterium]|nr:ATP-binding protein [Patescibacteria group bacterium]
MITKISSAGLMGIKPFLVQVEAKAIRGVPRVIITGLGDQAVSESKHRIITALKNIEVKFKACRVVVNLAPANIRKKGSHFDLAITVAILSEFGYFSAPTSKTMFLGEIGLNGELRPVRGLLNMALLARQLKFNSLIVPLSQKKEVRLIDGIDIFAFSDLKKLLSWNKGNYHPAKVVFSKNLPQRNYARAKYWHFISQFPRIERILQIAGAGKHNLLLVGANSFSMQKISRCLLDLFLPPTNQELLEINQIYSLFKNNTFHIKQRRPYRSIDTNITKTELVGSSRKFKPGEFSLAHKGILFVNNLDDFSLKKLNLFRQPLAEKRINLSLGDGLTTLFADFLSIACFKPCPCGNYGSQSRKCLCNPAARKKHLASIPLFLLKSFDLFIYLTDLQEKKTVDLFSKPDNNLKFDENKKQIREARTRQIARYKQKNCILNSGITQELLSDLIKITSKAKAELARAQEEFKLPLYSCLSIIKVAQTIADLDQKDEIKQIHIREALQYRWLTNT